MKRLLALLALVALPIAAQVEHTGLGSCIDNPGAPNQVDYSDTIQWSSDIQGPLGTGATITPVLNVGTHLVTATCADAAGNGQSAVVEVTVDETDTTPPTLTITVEPTVAQAGISITPEDPIYGNYSLKVRQGSEPFLKRIEGVPDATGYTVEDWGTELEAHVMIRHRDAVIADGFELVVMRGVDGADQPLWDLVLVGTGAEPGAIARVYEAQGQLSTPPVALPETTNSFRLDWRQHASLGLVRLWVNSVQSGEILGLNTDREMKTLLLGAPASTSGLSGHLLFDDFLVPLQG
jgi:hypothetical protein